FRHLFIEPPMQRHAAFVRVALLLLEIIAQLLDALLHAPERQKDIFQRSQWPEPLTKFRNP
ncbi:hypothetical protein, partial [Mesorhizobium sp.]|uniref:hypothetical protein n=1 Tax=Mesorhizobium sp. TaxID=1871066 RepID=UPI0025BA2321